MTRTTAPRAEEPTEAKPGSGVLGIGAVANATGLTVTTLRHYEDVGLIQPSHRVGGKRRYHPDILHRLAFIRAARWADLSLDQIRMLLDQDDGWEALMEQHLLELNRRRAELDRQIAIVEKSRDCGCVAVLGCGWWPAEADVPSTDRTPDSG